MSNEKVMKTKKSLFAILLLFVIQSTYTQDFSIGIRDGINWSSINGEFRSENTDIQHRTGHNFGMLFNYQLNSLIIIQTEINFEQKGFKYQEILLGGGRKGDYQTSYVTIPIIVHYEVGNKVKYYGLTGLYFGILAKVENYTSLSTTSSPYITVYDLSYDPSNIFEKIEFGGIIGLGAKIPICDKVNLIIETRYNFGLTKITENIEADEKNPDSFQNVYNRSITLSLGFAYKLKREKK